MTKLDKNNIAIVLEYEKSQDITYTEGFDVGLYYIWVYLDNGSVIGVDLDASLNENLLWKLNRDELALLRNAYYAKHGYIFSKKIYSNFFIQYAWYRPTNKNVESKLSKTDKVNIALIKKYENK